MRKITILLLIAALLLSGCQAMQIKPTVQYVSTQYYPNASYPQQMIIHSKAELWEYYETLTARHADLAGATYIADVNLEEPFAQYDDAYFRDNILVMIVWATGSGGDRFQVTKAEKENDTLTVHIKQTQDGMTCDMAAWHFLIELDKKYDTNEVSIIEK